MIQYRHPTSVSDRQTLMTDNYDPQPYNKEQKTSFYSFDYRKACYSVPHDWLIKSLEIHKFPVKLINFYS